MIYITGDTHRMFERVETLCSKFKTTLDDVIVILGDVGINYFGEDEDNAVKAELGNLPITMLCIHGNHEQRPESIKTYKEVSWREGIVYQESKFPNLLFAKDGEIYNLDGKRCMAIGGAYSSDKDVRVIKNYGWWADEQPSEEIKAYVEKRLDLENWNIDVVFSHTCPLKYIPLERYRPCDVTIEIDISTEKWLDDIERKLNYQKWYCGHAHVNKSIDKMKFLYEDIVTLEEI